MRCVIIGGDAGGMSAASQIRRRQPDWDVVVLERGPFTSYSACGIPHLVAGDIGAIDDLVVISPEQFRERRDIDVRVGWRATALDLEARKVFATAREGEAEIVFDRLLLATGARPILPDWPGADLQGVCAVRSLSDAVRFLELLDTRPRRAAVLGAGYIGLEMAEALRKRGLAVEIFERTGGVFGGSSEEITHRVAEELAAMEVSLHLQTEVTGFEGSDGRLRAVRTDGRTVEADLAVVGLGVRPNSELARQAGVRLGPSGAIRVDPLQRTSAPDVFAAGDCTEAWHRVLEKPVFVPLALGANRQGRVAGTNMAGGEARFPGILGTAVTRIFDLALGRVGIDDAEAQRAGIPVASASTTSSAAAHYMPEHGDLWIELRYRTDNLRVVGAALAGHDPSLAKRCDVLATAIAAGMTVGEVADLDLAYAPPFSPVWDPVLQVANKIRLALDT